jgi:hypothetical protein
MLDLIQAQHTCWDSANDLASAHLDYTSLLPKEDPIASLGYVADGHYGHPHIRGINVTTYFFFFSFLITQQTHVTVYYYFLTRSCDSLVQIRTDDSCFYI